MVRWIVAFALVLTGCISEPTDSVEFGELCLPSSGDCPSVQELSRDAIGRNQLDYTIENQGTSEITVRMIARIPSSDVVDMDDAGADAGVSVEDAGVIVERTHIVPAGESQGNRWTPQVLGTRATFEFEAQCVGCTAKIDYVLGAVPLECIQDSDCSSGWFCDETNRGRCVECRDDSDCDIDQRCDEDRGRCDPPKIDPGCSTVIGGSDFLLFGGLFMLGLGFLRRRKRIAGLGLSLLLLLPTTDVHAEPPVASLSVGAGARSMTGDVGANSDVGLGLYIAQELRWTYIGAAMGLDASYYLTDPEAPPFSNDFSTTTISIGPRGYIPISDWEIVFGADYARLGVSSNSLIRLTGDRTGFHGVGGIGGVRFQWSGLEARAQVGYQHIFDFPGAILTADLAIAVSTAF